VVLAHEPRRAGKAQRRGAIDRLRAGQRLAHSGRGQDFIEASVIDARLRDLEAQRRRLNDELRGKGGGAEQ